MSWVGASILPMPTSSTPERRNGAGAIYTWHESTRLQEHMGRVGASTIPMPARPIPRRRNRVGKIAMRQEDLGPDIRPDSIPTWLLAKVRI
jgi:hypothetical protein